MSSSFPPSGYTVRSKPGGEAVVWTPAASWADDVLTGRTLHGWAEAQSDRTDFPGRGHVHAVPAPCAGPDDRARWAVRHYRRGGAMAMHLGDRYLRAGLARPFRELSASDTARRRGVRTPAVVAGATYHDGPYYRCDLVTELVPDVRTLAALLHEHDGTRGWLVAMARAGDVVRELARHGIYHVDLNARNILLSDDSAEPGWVVDLDRARVVRPGSERARERMELRLVRSIVKVGTPTGEQLGDRELLAALANRSRDL